MKYQYSNKHQHDAEHGQAPDANAKHDGQAMKSINDNISCPVLRIAYATLLGEWYDHDQHFDSPLLDQLRQIEEAHNVPQLNAVGDLKN